jgi:hypothetical protein
MTTWSFAGVALSTYGKVTLMDDYLDMSERRGDNIEIPYLHGRVDVKKFFDERHITIGIGIHRTTIAAIETVFDDLRVTLGLRQQQLLVQTRADASVRQAYARVENVMNVSRDAGGKLAQIVIDFLLAEPFFRDDGLLDQDVTIDASPKSWTAYNNGTVGERNPTIILTGPLDNVVITNTTNGCILRYNAEIDAGDTVTMTIDANGQFTATHSVDGEVIGNVEHEGETVLMVLDPAGNDLEIESDTATTGTVQITFYPPYF